jgi:hypothetical protein
MGRRIVRPKIESPIEPQALPEASESGVEIITEQPEVEVETRDEKLESAAVLEITEVVSTSTIIAASTAGLPEDLTGARKRPSSQAEGSVEDSTSANKKQKGIDLRAAVESETVEAIAETIVFAEPKTGEIDVDNSIAVAIATDNSDLNTVSPESAHMIEMIENNQEAQPTSRNDLATPKRPRIVRPGTLSTQPASAQREDIVLGVDEEKDATVMVEPSAEIMLEREAGEVLTEVHLRTITQPSPERNENVEAIDVADNTALQALSQDNLLVPDTEGSENLLIDLNETTDSLVDSRGTTSHVDIDVLERSSEQRLPERQTSDNGIDMEDGEIDPEEKEGTGMEVPPQLSGDTADDSNVVAHNNADKDVHKNDEVRPEGRPATTTSDTKDKHPSASESSENVNVSVGLRQARRAATVAVPERLMGRRLGGTLPPSPGAARRSTRSAKVDQLAISILNQLCLQLFCDT